MATLVLSAAGAAIGGSIGGTVAGLSSVAVGRALGASLGRAVDQTLLGQGSEAVETGRVDRFRLTGAGEGAAIAQLRGRMRLGGHVIWASDFTETVTESGGGKGQPAAPRQRSYGYSVSLAIALCEGEIAGIGRVWADGTEIAASDLNIRVYTGSADQLPDPAMEAVEGAGLVPAYRGTAYVVVEDLSLERFGNRVPQFSFEVIRPEQRGAPGSAFTPTYGLRGVALIPGTGEYALATTPVNYLEGPGVRRSANVATPRGETDFAVSLGELTRDLPELEAVSLVVSWFGDDLRCGRCRVRPKVEDVRFDGETMPWQVSGQSRAEAKQIARQDGRPVYGGTPCDAAVMEAIAAMKAVGKKVMFYPFILMEQLAGNMLPDPYSDAQSQPALPWRGRITLEHAPGRPLSSDGTDDATTQVGAFFGAAKADDFAVSAEGVRYSGPAEWGFARFILHYAALCKAAGGVDAFCIGSEMRGLTQIRGAGGVFVAVERLRQLAREVRAILGPEVKISYAADWSEYFGYAPQDGSGDRFFHLDPLWSDETIDFIGIDNYMPLSDWREGDDHLDRGHWDSIYDADYLRANIEGGEGYDWYYRSQEARDLQIRTPITDGAHGEPWVHRYKDLRGWWSNAHHERIGGVRQTEPTAWQPGSKPIWFTEYGCAAINKGTNQPNKFLDPKSSESRLPHYSDGGRDDYLQMQYLRAVTSYWAQPAHNPVSADYGGPMIDMTRAFAWAWDARPFPAFPNDRARWSDGENYGRGHWLNGRTSNWALSAVVRDICDEVGVQDVETGRTHGAVRGYLVDRVGTGRAALQPLMLRHAFDAVEREGQLQFRQRDGEKPVPLDPERLALTDDLGATLIRTRAGESELSGRVRVQFVEADGSFEAITEEATLSDEEVLSVSGTEVNLLMTRGEGRQVALRWLMEARVGRDSARFALPPSRSDLGPGDVVALPGPDGSGAQRYRIDRVDQGDAQIVDALRIEPEVYRTGPAEELPATTRSFAAPVPVTALLLDLPLLRGDEVPHAPRVAAFSRPWPERVSVYRSSRDEGYRPDTLLDRPATIGLTRTPLWRARSGIFDRGPMLEVELLDGALQSVSPDDLLGGANLAAIGDGSPGGWEVFQFAEARLIAPQTYQLSLRLRGQAGTDGVAPLVRPPGAWFVLLDGAVEQIDLPPNLRGVMQHLRIGPAARGYDDPSYTHIEASFEGVGLRPYAPCHLRQIAAPGGTMRLEWIRRTRVDGDPWGAGEVPLGEESEQYLLQVRKDGSLLREESLNAPFWEYTQQMRDADGIAGLCEVTVQQISARYGPGPAARLVAAL